MTMTEELPIIAPEAADMPEVESEPTKDEYWTAERRKARGEALAASRAKARAEGRMPGKRRTGTRSKTSTVTDYRPGIQGLLQTVAFGLGVAAKIRPEFALDAMAISMHTNTVAEALNDTAQTDSRIAAVLDKVMAVGPYGALLGALIPLGMQIAANHKIIPSNAELGVLSAEELFAKATEK